MKTSISALKLTEEDNVATLLTDAQLGEEIKIMDKNNLHSYFITVKDNIKTGHKVALKDVPLGSNIIKYGQVIGIAKKTIKLGMWVHVHNLESVRGRGDKTDDSP